MDQRRESVPVQHTAPLATRAAGLERLAAYLPRTMHYARERNVDKPDHTNVSRLSMYLKYRLVLESEVVGAVISRYRAPDVEKFLQEVLWRTYWKGWLERHPTVWDDYLLGVERDRIALSGSELDTLEAATRGHTDIACFNHWVDELVSTGYLHNHARMWFASIWIFTLRLPWKLGAAFFLRHLHDGDPASNTLSWRWVAGLQTPGKNYLARAANIRRYTEGRFNPAGQLNETASPVSPEVAPVVNGLTTRPVPDLTIPAGLLMTGDDLALEASELRDARILTVAGGWSSTVTRRLALSDAVVDGARTAIRDGLSRASTHFGAPAKQLSEENWAGSVVQWARTHGLAHVMCLASPAGPWRDELASARDLLQGEKITLHVLRRGWDECFWPYASAGYFRFKDKAWPFLRDMAASPFEVARSRQSNAVGRKTQPVRIIEQ